MSKRFGTFCVFGFKNLFCFVPFGIDLMEAVPASHKEFLNDLVWFHEEVKTTFGSL